MSRPGTAPRTDREIWIDCSHCGSEVTLATAKAHYRDFWSAKSGSWRQTKNGQPFKPDPREPDPALSIAAAQEGETDAEFHNAMVELKAQRVPAERLLAQSRQAWHGLDYSARDYGAESSDDEGEAAAFQLEDSDEDDEAAEADGKELQEEKKELAVVIRPQFIPNAADTSGREMRLLLLLKAFLLVRRIPLAAGKALFLLISLFRCHPLTAALTHHRVNRALHFHKDGFEHLVVCPTCSCVRTLETCIFDEQKQSRLLRCDCKHFPDHPHPSRQSYCNAELVRLVKRKAGPPVPRPLLVMPYRPLLTHLVRMLQRPNFEDQLEHWRTRFRSRVDSDPIVDVHDGKLWRDWQTFEGQPLLAEQGTLALSFFGDWIQPFSTAMYSLGFVMAVIANLPRAVRFHRENVILVQAFPGGSEKVDCQQLLKRFVEDLLELFKGVVIATAKFPRGRKIRVVLLQCIADAPALRKLLAFVGITATCGCFRCTAKFPSADSSGGSGSRVPAKRNFDTNFAALADNRTRADMMDAAKRYREATSPSKRKEVASSTGCRSSAFLKLPYFDPARCGVIGAMHNLYEGTMKVKRCLCSFDFTLLFRIFSASFGWVQRELDQRSIQGIASVCRLNFVAFRCW